MDRFRRAGRGAVRRMWARQRNERGEPLSQYEPFSQSVLDPFVKRELIDMAYGYERIAKMAGDRDSR